MARILALNWQDLKHPAAGGAEVHLELILQRLVRRGHEVDLLCCNFPGGLPEEIVNGVRIIRRGSRPFFNWIAPLAFRALIKAEKYDIVFEDINKIPFYTPLYHRLPMLVIIPHLFSDSIFKEINALLGAYIYLAERPFSFVYRKKPMMVISESTAEEMCSRGINRELVHIVKCGIDHSVYFPSADIPKYEQPTFAYVGRIKRYKCIDTAIKALPLIRQSIPEARLLVVGTGDYLDELKSLAVRLKMERHVEFTGFVSEEKKVEIMRRSHLLVYPSLKEGWGLTNIEANACGTPVLASRVPGLRDSVDEGVSGLLFKQDDLGEFTAKATAILGDGDLRAKLEKGAVSHAAKFSWDKTAELCEQIMLGILGGRA